MIARIPNPIRRSGSLRGAPTPFGRRLRHITSELATETSSESVPMRAINWLQIPHARPSCRAMPHSMTCALVLASEKPGVAITCPEYWSR
jgi:hypothetical protein